jgi:plasmid stabilization system protein ParE
MKHRIELAATAKADIREQVRWLRDQISPAAADRWLAGLDKVVATLETWPMRFPTIAGNDKFTEELRELLYGKRKSKHRAIYTVRGDTVFVLYVRHSARDELEP